MNLFGDSGGGETKQMAVDGMAGQTGFGEALDGTRPWSDPCNR